MERLALTSTFGSPSSDFGATGGGVSGGGDEANFPVPAYQAAAGITEVTDSRSNSLIGRAVPDVAGMVSVSGFFVNGISYSFTGTSCAAPLSMPGSRPPRPECLGVALGFLNPTLYQLGGACGIQRHHQGGAMIPRGDTPADSPFFTAGARRGRLPTGWGSTTGTKLLTVLPA